MTRLQFTDLSQVDREDQSQQGLQLMLRRKYVTIHYNVDEKAHFYLSLYHRSSLDITACLLTKKSLRTMMSYHHMLQMMTQLIPRHGCFGNRV